MLTGGKSWLVQLLLVCLLLFAFVDGKVYSSRFHYGSSERVDTIKQKEDRNHGRDWYYRVGLDGRYSL